MESPAAVLPFTRSNPHRPRHHPQYNLDAGRCRHAAPLLAGQWSLSDVQVGLLTTLTFAGMAIGSLIAGITGDRYGRRVTYIYNLALYTAGAALAAFCPGFGWLLVARFIVGIGLGGELNTGLTLVAELMPTKDCRHRRRGGHVFAGR